MQEDIHFVGGRVIINATDIVSVNGLFRKVVKGRNTASSNVFGVSLGLAFDAWDIPDPTRNAGQVRAEPRMQTSNGGEAARCRPASDRTVRLRTSGVIAALGVLVVLTASSAAAQTTATVAVSRAQRTLGQSMVVPVSWYGISAAVSHAVTGRVGITGSYSWWRPDDDVVGDTIVVGATYRLGPPRWRLRPALLVGAWRTARGGESWAPALGAGLSWGGRFGGTLGTAFMRPRRLTYAVSRLGVYYALR